MYCFLWKFLKINRQPILSSYQTYQIWSVICQTCISIVLLFMESFKQSIALSISDLSNMVMIVCDLRWISIALLLWEFSKFNHSQSHSKIFGKNGISKQEIIQWNFVAIFAMCQSDGDKLRNSNMIGLKVVIIKMLYLPKTYHLLLWYVPN